MTSVPSPRDVQATYAAVLVDQWVAMGLSDVVICPGSRSTPLAIAFHQRDEIRCHVRIDERSAGFFAIGLALATRHTVAIVVTSGTAAAELHAAVAEADLAYVPLLVITADRPPELHGVGAPQTIEQTEIFASMVRQFAEPGVARWEQRDKWAQIAQDLFYAAEDDLFPGPVHLNAAFDEPLVGDAQIFPPSEPAAVWTSLSANETCPVELRGRRVLVVAGSPHQHDWEARCREMSWALLTDATGEGSLPYADVILRSDEWASALAPDVVLRAGGVLASKTVAQRLREWKCPVVAVSTGTMVGDPDRRVDHEWNSDVSDLDATLHAGNADYVSAWEVISERVGSVLAGYDEWTEIAVARRVVSVANEHEVTLVVGSSMPVRDVEWWSETRRTRIISNRGANGIDGVLSTILGAGVSSSVVGYVGDVTFLHDVGSLVDGLGPHGGSAVIVVSDNRGGGIFSFLPQADALDAHSFGELFTTTRDLNLAAIASSFGHWAATVRTHQELDDAIRTGLSHTGVSVVVAALPPVSENVGRHEELIQRIHAEIAT